MRTYRKKEFGNTRKVPSYIICMRVSTCRGPWGQCLKPYPIFGTNGNSVTKIIMVYKFRSRPKRYKRKVETLDVSFQ